MNPLLGDIEQSKRGIDNPVSNNQLFRSILEFLSDFCQILLIDMISIFVMSLV